MSDELPPGGRFGGGRLSRRAALGAIGAAAVGSYGLLRGRGTTLVLGDPAKRVVGQGSLPTGWLDKAPIECVFRVDDNAGDGEGVLSTAFSGTIGKMALLLRTIMTQDYEAMEISGHYGTEPIGGTVNFGPDGDEDVFSVSAHLGSESISLKCAGGTTEDGKPAWPVKGTMGGETLSAVLGGPKVSVTGDTVTFFFGTLGPSASALSFRVSGQFKATDLMPLGLSVAMTQGSVKATSSLSWKYWESPYLGAVFGTLSGPPLPLIAGLGWWTAVFNRAFTGIEP